MKTRTWWLFALGLFVLSGTVASGETVTAQQGPLAAEFQAAANEYGVPAELLLAMGYVNTRWETPAEPSRDGGWGVMHLVENQTEDSLGESSRLTAIPEERLRTDPASNIRGGAALLARAQGTDRPADLNAWYDAVAQAGGALYANQVFQTLQSGATATISTGETLYLAPQNAAPRELFMPQGRADYPGATWYPASSSNYSAAGRPDSDKIDKIVIHVTQSSYASAMNWFKDPNAYVSAHYTVRSSDGYVGQSVHEKDIAWHAGNWDYNKTSIGIEHEGYVSDPKWFTDAMYRSSAKLAAYLVRKYNIPVDRDHIVGHNEVPGADHTDPGPHWDWGKYIRLVRQYAGDTGGEGYTRVVDNADNATSGRFSASGSWGWSRYSPTRYYWNYRFTAPKATRDTAKYRFDIPVRDDYAVYAWWPSNPGYNTAAPIGIKTSSGWRWVTVDQTKNGGRWVFLGTFNMERGDEWKIQVSRWTGGEGIVIADAMKVVRQ
jgi:hypothetical protein